MTAPTALGHALLEAAGVAHGFGLRESEPPPGVRRPRQVHGIRVVEVHDAASTPPHDAAPDALGDADAVVGRAPGVPVGVVTADCVPVLVSADRGAVVAAVHAGWRGLAAGVVARALDAVAEHAPDREGWVAVVGPHIGPCCYEVDTPVLDALADRFGPEMLAAQIATRPGHARIALGRLVRADLRRAGVPDSGLGRIGGPAGGGVAGACTRCDPARFHSYRRDGAAAGRLLHWIAAAGGAASGLDTPGGSP